MAASGGGPQTGSATAAGRRSDMWTRHIESAGWGAVLLSAWLALSSNVAAQERAPSDDELHSMYCVEVLRTEITLQQHLISASSEATGAAAPQEREQWIETSAELLQRLAKLEDALRHLQVYMLPRIPTLDSRALAAAIRRANADAEQSDHAAQLSRVSACEKPP